jgi:hypothetical protein
MARIVVKQPEATRKGWLYNINPLVEPPLAGGFRCFYMILLVLCIR